MRYNNHDVRLPFFRPVKHEGGITWNSGRPRSSAQPFEDPKPAGLRRVFVVGESVAQRFSTSALAEALRGAWGVPAVEVVNCGMGAYDSVRVAAVLREALVHDPDLAVVFVGNNDGLQSPAVWYPAYRLNLSLRRLWLWRLAQDRLRPRAAAALDREALLTSLEANLRGMARAARAKKVPLVFCTLPVNEREWPPAGELPLFSPEFFKGWMALEEKHPAAAIERLRAFTREAPRDPMGHFWLAKALEAAGRKAEAREEFGLAIEWNWPDRCTSRRNELIRRVAREEGAAVAEVDGYARGLVPGGSPGWESFIDAVHWLPELDVPISALIAGAATGTPAKRLLPHPTGAPIEGVALHAFSDAMQAQLEYDPPILSEHVVVQFQRARRLDPVKLEYFLRSPEATARALAENPWTAFLAGRAPGLWTSVRLHAGEALWRTGSRAKAVALFQEAVKQDPTSSLARLLLAKSLLAVGDRRAGAARLDAIPSEQREAVIARMYRAYYGL
jgi:tetratricopeptide (TPR) repeat protein